MIKYLVVTFLLIFIDNIFSQDFGHIQVKSESGINILIDGVFKGTTSDQMGGLIIENVPTGQHIITAEKIGYNPQHKEIVLKLNEVYLFSVSTFIPKIEIEEEGLSGGSEIDLKVGCLVIQSLPIECVINITGLGINEYHKKNDIWRANKVPANSYVAIFKSLNKTIQSVLKVNAKDTTHFLVNFLDSSVTKINKEHQNNSYESDITPNSIHLKQYSNQSVILSNELSSTNDNKNTEWSYVGVRKCKMCHNNDGIYPSWEETKHAKAWNYISEEDKQKGTCINCHATGVTSKGEVLGGVQCEACHGPGSAYKSKKLMIDRELSRNAGLYIVNKEICSSCHRDDLKTCKK